MWSEKDDCIICMLSFENQLSASGYPLLTQSASVRDSLLISQSVQIRVGSHTSCCLPRVVSPMLVGSSSSNQWLFAVRDYCGCGQLYRLVAVSLRMVVLQCWHFII